MSLKLYGGMFLLLLLAGCGGGSESMGEEIYPPLTITFTEQSSVNVENPDRGFHDVDHALELNVIYNRFAAAYSEGYRLVYAPLNLEEYNETVTLPASLTDTVAQNLHDANNSGVKLILRLKYRSFLNENDPSKEIILAHMEQLKPLFQSYSSVISVVQAGTIGAWGEWHSCTGDFAEDNPDYRTNRRAIIEKLTEIFPDKYIQIRTPMHKELLFGSSVVYGDENDTGKITPEIAYSSDIRAKTGHHNDCFLSNETDMGTYTSDNTAFWKQYVQNDSKYAPLGGETCGIGVGEDAALSDCSNAVAALKSMHYAYLNSAYHPDVLQKWKDQGCYQTINENLGYRLVAGSLTITQSPKELALSLNIENKGYAAPYVAADVAFILKNSSYSYRFEQSVDIRTFYASEENTIQSTLSLENMEKGTYCLYLQIGRDHNAIRLSNAEIWDEESRSNRLYCTVTVE
ncbi:MAG TPA: DUF4832 domain-containing protein [Sulfurovum sp.]|nr:DUF4832 domain-containing protein [Sulfurovum sp.]